MKNTLHWKAIVLGVFLPIIFFMSMLPADARFGRGGSSLCYSSDGVVVDIDITDIVNTLFGTDLDVAIGDRCRAIGGTYRSVLPQYVSPGRTNAPIQDVNSALQILVWFVGLAQVVFWILTVGFGLYAAYLYLFSGGNKEQAAQARRVLIYTVIAGVISVIAYSIPGVIDTLAN